MDRKKMAKKGDYIVVVRHEDKRIIGRVVHVANIAPRIAKFNGGVVEHSDYYIATECDEWRPRGDR
jgi:hypothetical protein